MRFIVECSEWYRSGALMSNGVDLGVNAETERSFSMHIKTAVIFVRHDTLHISLETAMQLIFSCFLYGGFQSRSGQHYGYCSRR